MDAMDRREIRIQKQAAWKWMLRRVTAVLDCCVLGIKTKLSWQHSVFLIYTIYWIQIWSEVIYLFYTLSGKGEPKIYLSTQVFSEVFVLCIFIFRVGCRYYLFPFLVLAAFIQDTIYLLLHVRAVTASATNSSSLDRSGLLNTEPVFFFHAELPTGDKCGQQKPITGGFGSEYR